MKLLITGSHGQVGTELTRQSQELGWDVKAVSHKELEITDLEAVRACVISFEPDAVINAAAYTAVDRAESDVDGAFAVNRSGPENLARVCGEFDIPLVHYSTDYVFDGSKVGAYLESDRISPLGVYGESKLAGEKAVVGTCSKYLILRTSWVFSAHGNNFVKTMLRLGSEREELGVVADQYGKPASAAEIARLTLEMLPKANDHWGVYHLAQPEAVNWHRFAQAIFDEAARQGMALQVKRVNAITTADYPTPAKRPANSELDCTKIEKTFGVMIRPWQESLAEVIKELNNA